MHHLKKIIVETIPYRDMRYETCGDYWEEEHSIQFRVAQMSDWRHEFLILSHEMVEWGLVKLTGTSIDEIDSFDKSYEEKRVEGDVSEPGDHIDAPYRIQHLIASGVEKILAGIMDVDWKSYEEAVNSLT